MADTKISSLTELTVAPAIDDEFVLVDKSDTTMGGTGTDKRIKMQTLDYAVAAASTGFPPTGVTFQNFGRYASSISVTGAALVNGTLKMCATWLPAGFVVTSITFASGTTALTTSGSGPHFWVALFDSSRNLLRQSNDDTAATWSASSMKTVNLSSTFTTTYTGMHYCGLMVHAGSTGTLPSNITASNNAGNTLAGFAPVLTGNSSTGLTATAPNPAGVITAVTAYLWCGVA